MTDALVKSTILYMYCLNVNVLTKADKQQIITQNINIMLHLIKLTHIDIFIKNSIYTLYIVGNLTKQASQAVSVHQQTGEIDSEIHIFIPITEKKLKVLPVSR